MILNNYKIKLKDVIITPFDEDVKPKTIDDIMYLYYTLEITNDKKKTIKFKAYDFPCLQNLKVIKDAVDNNGYLECMGDHYKTSSFNLTNITCQEHMLRLDKYVHLHSGEVHYDLLIYEEFGKSVLFTFLTGKELNDFINYIEKSIQETIDAYYPYKIGKIVIPDDVDIDWNIMKQEVDIIGEKDDFYICMGAGIKEYLIPKYMVEIEV